MTVAATWIESQLLGSGRFNQMAALAKSKIKLKAIIAKSVGPPRDPNSLPMLHRHSLQRRKPKQRLKPLLPPVP